MKQLLDILTPSEIYELSDHVENDDPLKEKIKKFAYQYEMELKHSGQERLSDLSAKHANTIKLFPKSKEWIMVNPYSRQIYEMFVRTCDPILVLDEAINIFSSIMEKQKNIILGYTERYGTAKNKIV